MIRTLIGTAAVGFLLAGCAMPQQPAATTTASADGTQQSAKCKKLV